MPTYQALGPHSMIRRKAAANEANGAATAVVASPPPPPSEDTSTSLKVTMASPTMPPPLAEDTSTTKPPPPPPCSSHFRCLISSFLSHLDSVPLLFLPLGFVAVGGYTAQIALFYSAFVRRRQWIGDREFKEFLALSTLFPGSLSSKFVVCIGAYLGGTRTALLSMVAYASAGFMLFTLAGCDLILRHPRVNYPWTEGFLPATVVLVIVMAFRWVGVYVCACKCRCMYIMVPPSCVCVSTLASSSSICSLLLQTHTHANKCIQAWRKPHRLPREALHRGVQCHLGPPCPYRPPGSHQCSFMDTVCAIIDK